MFAFAEDCAGEDFSYLTLNIIEPLTSLFSFWWIPSRLCCLHDLRLKVTRAFLLIFLLHNFVYLITFLLLF